MFDKLVNMANVGAFWLAASSFFVAIVVLLATVVIFIGQNKHTLDIRKRESDNKALELNQTSFHNAMECFEIVAAIKGLRPDGSTSSVVQLAAIESLSKFPEYRDVFPFLYSDMEKDNSYNNQATKSAHLAAVQRLIVRTKAEK